MLSTKEQLVLWSSTRRCVFWTGKVGTGYLNSLRSKDSISCLLENRLVFQGDIIQYCFRNVDERSRRTLSFLSPVSAKDLFLFSIQWLGVSISRMKSKGNHVHSLTIRRTMPVRQRKLITATRITRMGWSGMSYRDEKWFDSVDCKERINERTMYLRGANGVGAWVAST